MKLSSISVILTAAAGLASAAPIRVVIIATNRHVAPVDAAPEWAKAVRWGHAAAPVLNSLPPSEPFKPSPAIYGNPIFSEPERVVSDARPRQKMRGGCRGMRSKSLQLGNRLRIILGLPPLDYQPHHGMMRGTVVQRPQPAVIQPYHRHPHFQRAPLAVRLSHALASLGPWEGRAVSFVLGCGIGAILRMLFVFGVLIVRSIRARSQERQVALEEDTIIFVADIKEPIETPPAYAEETNNTPEGRNAAN